jgi:acyl dehydratase
MTDTQLWREYSEGLHLEWDFSISTKDMRLFSDLSGDRNPLHSDPQHAQTKGFDYPVVYGVLLCAQMSRLIGEEMPDKNSIIMGIQMDFLSPCFPEDALIFSADLISKSDSTFTYQCKCKIIKDNKVMCKGTVAAIWKP